MAQDGGSFPGDDMDEYDGEGGGGVNSGGGDISDAQGGPLDSNHVESGGGGGADFGGADISDAQGGPLDSNHVESGGGGGFEGGGVDELEDDVEGESGISG